MKELIHKTRRLLLNKRGELLLETVLSLMLFTVMLLAVVFMVTTSINITRETGNASAEAQRLLNADTMGSLEDAHSAAEDMLIIKGSGIEVSVPIEVSDKGGYLAFIPNISGGGAP